MKDRNEWFEEVERAYSKLKIVERPYAPPHAAVAVEAEDVLCCLGLHPHINASDWLVINLDEVSELIELIRPVPVTGATSDGYPHVRRALPPPGGAVLGDRGHVPRPFVEVAPPP
ncbi:MAG: hypothetical protein UE667_06010 [Collinsella sp.]|nr:hypothetical protein [Collinsella sp.]